MKTIAPVGFVLTALALAVLPANAATFPGTGNSLGNSYNDGAGISSLVVNNDNNNITFTINSSQPQASYIFYTIELQLVGQGGSGDMSLVNPWGPAVGISTGVNALVNTYGTGGSALTYSAGTWTQNASASYSAGGTGNTFAILTLPLTSLGLSLGSSFYVDVVSTYTSIQNGYPQSAYGALDSVTGYPAESDGLYQPWNPNGHQSYYDSVTDAAGSVFGTAATLYTVQPIPEPGTFALIGLGGLVLVQRLGRRNSK